MARATSRLSRGERRERTGQAQNGKGSRRSREGTDFVLDRTGGGLTVPITKAVGVAGGKYAENESSRPRSDTDDKRAHEMATPDAPSDQDLRDRTIRRFIAAGSVSWRNRPTICTALLVTR